MNDVAVVGFAQAPSVRRTDGTTTGVEMLVPIFTRVFDQMGLTKSDIGFVCSGSSDYLAGRAFSFIAAVDAFGAFPPIHESHVEMDAAWALYEAWLKIRTGEVDTALLRAHDIAPVSDGAAVIVLASAERAREIADRPARISGIEHRVDSAALGARELTRSPSTELAGRAAGAGDARLDVAELHAPFSHQELILREELGLGEDVRINPSGGALTVNPMFSAGLIRIGEAARHILDGGAERTLAHATSGPALQQNLVAVLERG